MVTIKDIANKLGVSISTVSKGLNDASDISEEMRQQVLDTATELGYIIKKKKFDNRRKVCIMVKDMDYENINQFGYEIITGFRMSAEEHHCEVSVLPLDSYMQTQQSYDSLMLQHRYSGAFFLGSELEDAYLQQLQNTSIPTVLFDNYVRNKYVGYVGTDNTSGIYSIVQHLYHAGHKKIAFLTGPQRSLTANLRYHAFLEAMTSFGLKTDSTLTAFGEFSPAAAKNYVIGFLEQKATAIVCASDLIASGVINELYRLGKKVPKDVSVTGFDDLPVARYLAPPLTTIRQERLILGQSAFTLLDALIRDIPASTFLLHGELIVRDSVMKPIFE